MVAAIGRRMFETGRQKTAVGWRLALAIAVVFLLVFGSVHPAGAENVKIAIPSFSVTTSPLGVARDRGFFAQEGLQAELVYMPAALTIKALMSGDLGYSTTVGSAVVAAVRGVDVRVAMAFVDRPLFDLVGSAELSSVAELKGKLVGISSRAGLLDVATRSMLQQSGVDPARVTLLVVGGQTAMLAAVKTGRISAGLLGPPYNFLAFREGLKDLGFAGDYVRIPSTCIVAMRERLERSPEQVRKVLRALTRARAFARENKPAALPILKRFLKLDDEDLLSKIYDYHRKAETADGRIDTALASETIHDARQSEGVSREIPVSQVFDFSLLDSLR